jgi:uncharacterized damage-inducible protein DinB
VHAFGNRALGEAGLAIHFLERARRHSRGSESLRRPVEITRSLAKGRLPLYTSIMVSILRELFRHQAHADASMLMAIKRHQVALIDQELRKLIHHILVSHRFWIHLSQGLPFNLEVENVVPATFEELAARFQVTHAQELAWLDRLQAVDLARVLESQYLPQGAVTVGEALTQVCLHSHGHRAQCATRLRMLGGEPPPGDYILWAKDRPDPTWV